MRWLAVILALLSCTFTGAGAQQLDGVRLEQREGESIPADAAFVDDTGQGVHLSDYLGQTPVLVMMGYYTCPALCPMAFRHMTEELNGIGAVAGRDFQVVVISIDPADTITNARSQKLACVHAYKDHTQADGFHFLIGSSASIAAAAEALGFHYTYDADRKQFSHPTGIMIASPAGKITHCFFGVDVSPKDVAGALRDAAAGRVTQVDQPDQQYCLTGDRAFTARGRMIMRIIDIGCILWAGGLFGYIGWKVKGELKERRSVGPGKNGRRFKLLDSRGPEGKP